MCFQVIKGLKYQSKHFSDIFFKNIQDDCIFECFQQWDHFFREILECFVGSNFLKKMTSCQQQNPRFQLKGQR